jgi:STE24 endopeptidase
MDEIVADSLNSEVMTDFSIAGSASYFTLFFACGLSISLLLKFWLVGRQIRHIARHRTDVPVAFAGKISQAAHRKAADYTASKTRFGVLEMAWGAAATLGWTLFGGLSLLNSALADHLGLGLLQQVALLLAFIAINGLMDLPFTLYQTFVIEQRFGFNKTSFPLWLQDFFKSSVLSLAIGGPLATLVLWMMQATGNFWWLWTWCVWMGFNLLALLVYPTWIAPIFNKFQPLEDPVVKDRVSQLMARCGFTSKGFFVMDGSKRSAHANAYFTGFGASKRVVFYDTLLAQLSPAEVDAVLAHELGHFKRRHIFKRVVSMFALSFAGFAALGWLSQQMWFYSGLGVTPNIGGSNDALALLLFLLVAPLAGSFAGPVLAQMSRQHEFEADAYAVSVTDGPALANALIRLYEDNASTLTPDPVYVKFYYSHPPASERIGRILASGSKV